MKGKRTNKPDLKSKSIGFDDISAFINKGWDKGKKALIEKRLSNSKQIALGALLAGATGNVLGRSIPVSHKNVDKKDSFLSKHAPNIMMSAGAAGMLANAFRDSKMNPMKRVLKDFKGGNPQTKALAALAGAGLGFRLGRVHALADMDAPYKEKRSFDKVAFMNAQQLKALFIKAPPAQKKSIVRRLLATAPKMLLVLGLTTAAAAAFVGAGNVAAKRNKEVARMGRMSDKLIQGQNYADLRANPAQLAKAYRDSAQGKKIRLAPGVKDIRLPSTGKEIQLPGEMERLRANAINKHRQQKVLSKVDARLGSSGYINPFAGGFDPNQSNVYQGAKRLVQNPVGFFGGMASMAGRGIKNTYRALGGGPALARSILL